MTTIQEPDMTKNAEILDGEHSEHEELQSEVAEETGNAQPPEWSNPILVLQLLQVEDRNFFRRIKETQERLDDARDELNVVIEEVFNLHPGFTGFVRRALLGAQVPAGYARLIESYNELIGVLEKHRDYLAEILERARLLAAEAEQAADNQNTLVFRQRALRELSQDIDTEAVEAAERRVRMYRALLEEEEEMQEELLEEPNADPTEAKKRGLGSLSGHFDEFKTKKAEEIKEKLLDSDFGKKGFRKLQELADRLEKKREERYADLLNLPD